MINKWTKNIFTYIFYRKQILSHIYIVQNYLQPAFENTSEENQELKQLIKDLEEKNNKAKEEIQELKFEIQRLENQIEWSGYEGDSI